MCTVGQKTPVFLNTNFPTEMKLVQIIMDYFLLESDALKSFSEVRIYGGGSQPNFNFFNINPQIFERNRNVHLSNWLETNFHISNINLRFIRRRIYS